MEEVYEYFCQYCSEFVRSEFQCPHCGEYKGLIKVSQLTPAEKESK
jgi:DNA-directed RNA polymerase subunit RPC12/RpoP